MLEMNLIEACQYKEKYPDRRVIYREEYTENGEQFFFEEELTFFRDEPQFTLSDGKYPSWHIDDGYPVSYRHIQGIMLCESEEETLARLEKKLEREMEDLKEKLKSIEELEKKVKKSKR